MIERFVRVVERVGEHGRRAAAALEADWNESASVAKVAVARWAGRRILRLAIVLRESGPQETDQRYVEHVEPNRRSLALVAMLVPRPRRRHDEVAGTHVAALACDRRVRAFTLDDETQRRGRVSMRASELAGH